MMSTTTRFGFWTGLIAYCLASLFAVRVLGAVQGDLIPSDAWVRLPAAGETTTTAFVTLKNATMYDVYVISATADVAGKVEFRDARKQGDAATQIVKNFTVPSYESLQMSPKGLHLILSDLKQPLKEGATVTLTLTVDGGSSVRVRAEVGKE